MVKARRYCSSLRPNVVLNPYRRAFPMAVLFTSLVSVRLRGQGREGEMDRTRGRTNRSRKDSKLGRGR